MRITRVSTVLLRLPEVRAVGDGTQDVLLVLVHTDAGLTGIGEVHTAPSVAEAVIHAPVSHVRSRGLASVLIGQDATDIEGLHQRMLDATEVYGRRGIAVHTVSGVDLALWDLRGKAKRVPVADLLGGRRHDTLPLYASVLMPHEPDEAAALARHCVDLGFSAVKFGWGGLGSGPDRVRTLIDAVKTSAPDLELMLDLGAGVHLEQARRLVEMLAPFGLQFLEEPLHPDDLEGFAALSTTSPIPIATGEKEATLAGFRLLMDHGYPDVIQPDLARAGGITEVERIWQAAQDRSVRVVPHCWSTDILVGATAQFLATREPETPLEFCMENNALRRHVARDPLEASRGRLPVPTGPGLGVELNHATLRDFAVSVSHPLDELLVGM